MVEAADFTVGELMTCVFAHHLGEGELAIMGANSAIPMAACRLAQLTHAPSLSFIVGGSGAVNSLFEPMPASSCDAQNLRAECVLPLPDVIDVESRKIDVFFAGGLQIDKYGNCNLLGIGKPGELKFRGPGSVGLPFLSRARRFMIYTASHNKRTLVEKVDFISGPGFLDGKSYRGRIAGSGPALVVTPICVMDFDETTKSMRLKSTHPNVSVQQVRENTGFELVIPEKVTVTHVPTKHQVEILRKIDPGGIARNSVKA
jgi:glutaconate CoA-transferase subunit B